jgi:hypothetical protein
MEADGRPAKRSSSPWIYVVLGCGIAVILALIGISGLTYLGYRSAKQMEANFKDPAAREASVKKVVPYQRLPAGYYPAGAISIPMLMDFAIFSDRQPEPGQAPEQGSFNQRSFIYMNMRHLRDNKEKMERYLRGEAPAPEDSAWKQSNVNFDEKELIRRGTVNVGNNKILFAAHRGNVTRKGEQTEKTEGIVTMVMPECPNSNRMRFGIWITPDPQASKPLAEANYAGTSADPAGIADFLGHFDLCGGT